MPVEDLAGAAAAVEPLARTRRPVVEAPTLDRVVGGCQGSSGGLLEMLWRRDLRLRTESPPPLCEELRASRGPPKPRRPKKVFGLSPPAAPAPGAGSGCWRLRAGAGWGREGCCGAGPPGVGRADMTIVPATAPCAAPGPGGVKERVATNAFTSVCRCSGDCSAKFAMRWRRSANSAQPHACICPRRPMASCWMAGPCLRNPSGSARRSRQRRTATRRDSLTADLASPPGGPPEPAQPATRLLYHSARPNSKDAVGPPRGYAWW